MNTDIELTNMSTKELITCAIAICLVSLTMMATLLIPTTQGAPEFVVATGEQYDQYGQGIVKARFYSNHTGDWEPLGGTLYPTDADPRIDGIANHYFRVHVFGVINATMLGINKNSPTEGKLYQRYNLTIYSGGLSGEQMKQHISNLTYVAFHPNLIEDDDLIGFEYRGTSDFRAAYLVTYICHITMEVWYT